jgi:hypothetical protein
MPIIRCSQKLLRRLRVKPVIDEPPPAGNPLGEWCANVDFVDHAPHVLLMNAATGALLVLPGRAADLKRLHELAAAQLALLFRALGIQSEAAGAELGAWQEMPRFTRNSNRSLVTSMNLRKHETWLHLADHDRTPFEVALRALEAPFSRKELGRDFHFAADLLRSRLLPSAAVVPLFPVSKQ